MCVFSFGSFFADFGRYLIERQSALQPVRRLASPSRTVSGYRTLHRLRRSLAALLLSLPLLLGLAVSAQAQVLIGNIGKQDDQSTLGNLITDLIQMRNAERRKIAEFGNHKANGGIRVLVDIGDGLSPQGYARTINYTVGGTAERGDGKDYTIDNCCSVRLRANTHTVPITINVNDDGLDEGDETIVLTLQDGSGYTVNKAKRTTTVMIVDNDTRGLTFHRRWPDVGEGASVTYTVKLASQPTAAVTVNIASDNPDVTVTPTSLTFNPSGSNIWSRARTVTIDAAQDDDAVNDEATLTHTTSGGDYGGDNALSIDRPVRVDDDETSTTVTPQLPRISLTGGDAVTEGAAASFTVNADPVPTSSLTVNVEVIELPGRGDFVVASEEGVRTVTLNAGATSATFTVPTENDNIDEEDGGVQVFVNEGTGYSIGQGAAVTVLDDDGPTQPVASFASGSSIELEDAGTGNVTVNLSSAAPSGGLTLNYSVAGTATAGNGNDFTISGSGTLSILAGATSATIPVAINDDSTEESAETVILTLTGGTGYTLGSTTVHTLTITDNDGTTPVNPAASFASALSSATEKAGTRNVTVNLSSAAPSGGLTLSYDVSGTATSGSGNDFTIQNSGTVEVAAGANTATILVAINDDSAQESAETVILTLTDGTGYTLGNTTVHTLTITDNDDQPPPTTPAAFFASVSSSVGENAGTRNVTVNLSSAAPSGGLTLNYSVAGTATAGSGNDFTILGSGTVEVVPGATTATIPIAINDDGTEENAETVILTLTGGTGYTLGSATVHTLTITDNDGTTPTTPAASFAAGSSSAAENAGTRNVRVNLSQAAPPGGLTLGYSVSGTATAGSGNDFTIQGSGTVTVAAGATTATIPVVINDDSTDENTETVILTLTGGTGYTLGSPTVHTLTITDNDGGQPPPIQPSITIRADIASVEEGTLAGFTVLASPAPISDLTISLRVSETTAEGQDYIAISDEGTHTITLNADATSARYTVPTEDDATEEPDGRVTVVVESGLDYRVSSTSDSASVTIADNDDHEISFASDIGQIREGGVHTISVHIDPAPMTPLTLRYRLSGTATLEEDYQVQTPGVVQVLAGKSQALIVIESIADEVDESMETVVLTLEKGSGLTIGTSRTHELTLIDAREASLEAGWSWLVRFGRTVAQQVVDSISQRLRATRIEGTQVNVAGAQLPVGQSRAFGTFEPPTIDRPFDYDIHRQTSAQGSTQTLSEREVIQSSSFMSGSETDAEGGNLVVWGQASHSSFKGREKDLSLDGDSTSVMLGADYAQQFWQAGATLIQSEGKGDYRDEDVSGEVEASLTSIVPWAAVQATERVQLWGALGTGDGDLELTEEDSNTMKTDIDWSMAAAGLRSVLIPASGENSLLLSLVGDALWVETKADPVEGLSIADAETSRLRLGLEGQHSMDVSSGAEVISRLEFGLRKDSGDAETGDGIEVGGGVTWSDARSGLTIELAGHKLLTYDTDELEDEGFSLSFDYDPAPDSAEGLSLSLNQEVGVRAKDGLEAVFGSEPLATRTDGEKENRVRLEAAYGVPVLGGRFIGSPHMGLGLATGSREYSLGWKVTPERHAPDLSFGVRATRTESDALVPAHAIRFETVFRW